MFSLSLRRDLPLLCFGKAANCGAGSGRGGTWSGLAGGICRRASGSCRCHSQVSCSIPAPFALWDALTMLPWDACGSGLPGWRISPYVSELCQNQPSTSAAFQAVWPPLASAPGAHAGGKNPSPSTITAGIAMLPPASVPPAPGGSALCHKATTPCPSLLCALENPRSQPSPATLD